MSNSSSRPEAAFVLLLLQATFWALAGLSALPFALAGELSMLWLGLFSLLFAQFVLLVGMGLVLRWRWARRTAMGLEALCLAGSLLLIALPIGANRDLVALLVNLTLPLGVIWMLRGRRMKAAFRPPTPAAGLPAA
jgi:hypothetical protein